MNTRADAEIVFSPIAENGTVSWVEIGRTAYEAMNDRDAAIGVLASAPPAIVTDILRHPDLRELRSDPRLARLGLGGQ